MLDGKKILWMVVLLIITWLSTSFLRAVVKTRINYFKGQQLPVPSSMPLCMQLLIKAS